MACTGWCVGVRIEVRVDARIDARNATRKCEIACCPQLLIDTLIFQRCDYKIGKLWCGHRSLDARKEFLAYLVVHRPAIIGVHQTEIPQLLALINILLGQSFLMNKRGKEIGMTIGLRNCDRK